MFLELFIDYLDKRLVKRLSKSNIKGIESILIKKNISIENINKICGYCLDFNNIEFNDKNMNDLLYLYLIRTKVKNNIKIVMESINYGVNIEDILLLDKYVSSRKCKDNELVFKTISKIWEWCLVMDEDTEFKHQVKKLYEFKKMFKYDIFPFELINNFVRVDKCNNFYFQLKEIEKVMISNNDLEFKKKMLLIFYTYNFVIDDSLINYFKDIDLSKNDVISFIYELEDKGIIINDMQLKNMLGNFRKNYLIRNNTYLYYNNLCDKVVSEYSEYYNYHFYFREKDFIKYYNNKYDDDFSCFVFRNDIVLLNEEILGSIFNKYSLLGDYFLFRGDVNTYSIFKNTERDACSYLNKQECIFRERKKFYRKYKSKINKYINFSDDMCFNYFLFKYIDEEDKAEFYELFKTLYRDDYSKLEVKKGSLKNSALLLKEDFLSELQNNSFSDRFRIKFKYVELALYIGCNNYIKDNYYDVVLGELERQYKLFLGKEVLYRLNNCKDKKLMYQKLEEYIKEELGIDNIDELFNSFSKKNDAIKNEYFKIKKSIVKSGGKCKVKKKVCK